MTRSAEFNVFLEYGLHIPDRPEPESIQFTLDWQNSFIPRVGEELILDGFDELFIVTKVALAPDGDVFISCKPPEGQERAASYYVKAMELNPCLYWNLVYEEP